MSAAEERRPMRPGNMVVGVHSVQIPHHRNQSGDLEAMMMDLSKNGQQENILVSSSLVLVDGALRLNAMRTLKRASVNVTILGDNQALRRLMDDIDNRIRAGAHLTLFMRARDIERRGRLFEAIYPRREERPMTAPQDFTKATGVGRHLYEQSVIIVRHMDYRVREYVADTPLADNITALGDIARLARADQMGAAKSTLLNLYSVSGKRVMGSVPKGPFLHGQTPAVMVSSPAVHKAPEPVEVRPKAKGLRKPRRETGRIEDVILLTTRARNGLVELCREWDQDRRLDMAFAIQARPNIEGPLNVAIRELQKLVEQCKGDDA